MEKVELIIGKAAPNGFINLVVYRALTHDPRIKAIDTCRVYHSGEGYVLEVDIVLPRDMMLETAHGIKMTI
jgi:divalent metal cation (Fe/Co/Zn/Cd) transporter